MLNIQMEGRGGAGGGGNGPHELNSSLDSFSWRINISDYFKNFTPTRGKQVFNSTVWEYFRVHAEVHF